MTTEHTLPVAMTSSVQQSLAEVPGIVPHPAPPQADPHSNGQHTSELASWIPDRPLSQVELLDATAGRDDGFHKDARRAR